ncbi:MAG: FHA domain-containing protein, partial [Gemmataceae bacterium]|nr:FHA domain-containing protein [Gemmataceae bacterium]
MPSKHDEPLASNRAGLVMLHGTADRSSRPLDRDVTAIGKASGCDVRLEAPDVSGLHCLISRGACGFHLRDCGSRAGIRLNGDMVREATLHDEDILQVGPFSFRVQIPAGVGGALPHPAEQRVWRLERSRRRLAQLALTQRRRLNALRQEAADGEPARLNRELSALRERVKDHDQRVRQLQQAEREVARDRDLLARDAADLDARMQQSEDQLAKRLADADVDINRRWEEFDQHCRQREQTQAAAGAELDALAARLEERQAQLAEQERRLAEERQRAGPGQDTLTAQLVELQAQVAEQEDRLAEDRQRLGREAEQVRH